VHSEEISQDHGFGICTVFERSAVLACCKINQAMRAKSESRWRLQVNLACHHDVNLHTRDTTVAFRTLFHLESSDRKSRSAMIRHYEGGYC